MAPPCGLPEFLKSTGHKSAIVPYPCRGLLETVYSQNMKSGVNLRHAAKKKEDQRTSNSASAVKEAGRSRTSIQPA